jgi:hypothetical protein
VFSLIHHDADMPAPHDQIAGLRLTHAHKAPRPVIEIQRAGVGIRIARLLVQIVYQMRAILCAPFGFGAFLPGGCQDDPQPFRLAQQT